MINGAAHSDDDDDDTYPGVDPTVAVLLREAAADRRQASTERRDQTAGFTAALDRLGERFEARITEQTTAMARAAYLSTGVVVLALLLLGSIGGAVVYLRGSGLEAATNGGAAAAPSVVQLPPPR